MIWVLSVYYVFLEGVCSTPVGADPTRCRFVHAVTVHAEKKRIPSNDLKNVGQPLPSVALCYFESLKINYFVCTWISWHKRLISLKCMNSDHVILQTTKKNIFSSIPLCDVIMTLKLNKKSFSPSFFFTNSLPGGFCHKQILCQENLIYEGNWTSPLGLIKTINTFSKSNSSGNTKYFPLLTWFPLTPFICRWYMCP